MKGPEDMVIIEFCDLRVPCDARDQKKIVWKQGMHLNSCTISLISQILFSFINKNVNYTKFYSATNYKKLEQDAPI